jgi:hypothetical protein
VVHPNIKNTKNIISANDFDRWYSIYPKRRGKGKARQVFERTLKTHKATTEELITGATRYAAERRGQSWRYTKDPATWLNGECWLDETPQAEHAAFQEEPPRKVAGGGRGRDPLL